VVRVLAIYAGFLALERVRPAEPHQAARAVWWNVQWWVLYSALSALLVQGALGGLAPAVRRAFGGPLVALEPATSSAGLLAHSLLFLFVFDLFYYGFHRLQHTWPLLWEQHRLHHSERALNVTTTQRHHWLEEPLRVFFIVLPMGLAFDIPRAQAGALAFGLSLWGFFIHSNLRLRLGWLTPLLVGPQLHRIHHSIEPEHMDRNFAAFFPIWDIAFGSYWRPGKSEFPATGLRGEPPPASLVEASLAPFRAWFGRAPRVRPPRTR
jgi:sterol desaturase/sphingolipid hydroxylase (fatty acid hydroxylase superfamily)